MDTIDKQSPIPLYYQLEKIILEKIKSGIWLPNMQIPPERELAEKFNLSRMTVRQALQDLTRNGILIREVGSGTFIAEPKITQGLSSLTSFSEDMRARGFRPSAKVIRAEIEPAGIQIANRLDIPLGTETVTIQRLRLASDEPMAIENSHLHFPDCRTLLSKDLSASLYGLISELDIVPTRAHQQISVALCTKEESRLLEIHAGLPVLKLIRTSYSQFGKPFEYAESTYRGDKYIFETELIAQEKSQ